MAAAARPAWCIPTIDARALGWAAMNQDVLQTFCQS
jgi:hypothetical protein